jgi:exopolysaccharide biosynthesis polyprenyl glycosylphosphotransferase
MTEAIDDTRMGFDSRDSVVDPTSGLSWPYVDRREARMRDRDLSLEAWKRAWPVWDPTATGAARPRRNWLRRYLVALLAGDVVAAVTAASVAASTRPRQHVGVGTFLAHYGFAVVPLCWLVGLWVAKAYEPHILGAGSEEFKRVGRTAVGLVAALAMLSYGVHAEIARGYVLFAVSTAAILTAISRHVSRRVIHRLRARGRCLQRVVGVGSESQLLHLVSQFEREPWDGLQMVAACLPDGGEPSGLLAEAGIPVLGTFKDVASVAAIVDADAVAATACPEMHGAGLRQLAWHLEGTNLQLMIAPGLAEVAGPRIHMRPIAGLSMLVVEQPQLSGLGRVTKGVVDRLVAASALVLLAPVLGMVAAAVRLTSPGPALFRQTRVGKGGREFTLYKFRSMVVGAEQRVSELIDLNENADGLLFKVKRDPRVTRVGRFLRRYSIDELPQLINVVRGDMSLVGPRPPLPGEVARYELHVHRRLMVRPGLTGLWQVSGRSALTWDESVRLDLRYVENWSLALDLMILWKTVFAVAKGSGAY